MPRITTFNIDLEIVKRASKDIINDIATFLKIDSSHISIQVNQDKFIFNGEIKKSHPFVELALFDRTIEVEDNIARIVTDHFLESGCASLDLYIVKLEPRRYFENGEHF